MSEPRKTRQHGRRPTFALLVPLLLLVPASPAIAQDGFLFGRPVATFSLMGGWTEPGEGSDLFDFTREHLTVERGEFASPLVFAEAAFRATERLDLALGLEHTSREVRSEMKDFVTMDDQPIPQRTTFSRTRLMASVKGYLLPRGREISEFAWVPTTATPYAGVGAGYSAYHFDQAGDFVDYETLDIFEDRFTASGAGWTAHALAGLQLSLRPGVMLKGEYRHIWGAGPIEVDDYGQSDFIGFEPVDLSGWRAMIGLGIRVPARRR